MPRRAHISLDPTALRLVLGKRKSAKVEFVAVLACLLRDHRVSVFDDADECPQQARERAWAMAEGL